MRFITVRQLDATMMLVTVRQLQLTHHTTYSKMKENNVIELAETKERTKLIF